MSGGGSPHLHSKFVRGCYRCEISRDEADDAIRDELADAEKKLDAIRAEVEVTDVRILRGRILEILDGPAGG